ncbi:NADH-quinone oxidoreductase subunit C [Streptomyces sp. NPDC005786]|uniref:NADH-quinone oxidoreductase subunit C n=1 Tax=Streptomyces sp. NPDC005786 TaxID=3154891 RepID=UPI0033FF2D05
MTAAESAGAFDRLPDAVTEIFGEDATAERAYELLTVDVPPASWTAALETARDRLGCTYFDWLSAVDEPGTGFRVCAHVAALPAGGGSVRRLLIRTTVPHEAAVLPTAISVYAGAAWHERETHEMFGIGFDGHPHLVPLLLPEGFEGHPLRKDFVLAARVAKAWPGAKEPGESEHGGPKRRTMLPPGVPDPNEWGPLKGQLPPAPARPARAARPTGDRPPRRTRTASDATPAAPAAPAADPAARSAPPRRTRSVSQGSASQQAATTQETGPAAGPGPEAGARAVAAPETGPGAGAPPAASSASDAPWHDARPAFDEPSGGRGESGDARESRAPAEPSPAEPAPEPSPAEPSPAEPAPAEPSPAEPAPEPPSPATPAPEPPSPAEPAPEPAPEQPTEQRPGTTPQPPTTPTGGDE